jgi:allantoin racemase
MNILFVNPNSTDSMTAKVRLTAKSILPTDVNVIAVSNPDGPPSIQGPQDGDLAVPGMLNVMQAHVQQHIDAMVIACFDDTGIEQARKMFKVPILGIGQAAYHASMLAGNTFSVVTTLSVSVPVIEQNINDFGVSPYCKRVRASEVPVLDLEKPGSDAEQRISDEISKAISEDQCEAIVLGCAGMTDLVNRMEQRHGLPIVDGVAAASGLAYGMALLSA